MKTEYSITDILRAIRAKRDGFTRQNIYNDLEGGYECHGRQVVLTPMRNPRVNNGHYKFTLEVACQYGMQYPGGAGRAAEE
jgi:hypothetical protein